MKHIKTYKVFESSNNIEDLKDICLELEDDGFRTNHFVVAKDDVMEVRINKRFNNGEQETTPFKYSEVSEVIERIKDYLGDYLRRVDILHTGVGPNKWSRYDIYTDQYALDQIKAISIEYYINKHTCRSI